MSRRGATATSLALLLAGGLLVACDGEDDATPAPDPPASTPATDAATPPPDLSGVGPWDAAVNELVEDPFYPDVGEPDVDALHYDLALRWDPQASRLTGVTSLTFRAPRPLTALQLDLAEPMQPSQLLLDGEAAAFTHEGRAAGRGLRRARRQLGAHAADRLRGRAGAGRDADDAAATSTASGGTRPRTAARGPCRSRGVRTPGTPSTTTRRTRRTTTSASTPPPRSTASPVVSWSPTRCTATGGSPASTSASPRRPTSPRSRSTTTGSYGTVVRAGCRSPTGCARRTTASCGSCGSRPRCSSG